MLISSTRISQSERERPGRKPEPSQSQFADSSEENHRPDLSSECCYVRTFPLAMNIKTRLQVIASAFNPVNGDLYVYDQISSDIYRFQENGEVETFLNFLDFQAGETIHDMQVSPDGRYLFFSINSMGADILVVDIESKEVISSVEMKPERFMIGSSTIVTEDNTVFKMGGYGYWDYRNILIQWSLGKPAWEAVQINTKNPDRGFYPFLYYTKETQELHYLFYPVTQPIPTLSLVEIFEYYIYDLTKNTWSKIAEYEFEEPLQMGAQSHKKSSSFALSPILLHVNQDIFYDRVMGQFVRSNHDYFELVRGVNAIYSERLQKRILVAERNTSNFRELLIQLVDEQDLKLTSIPLAKPAYSQWLPWMILLFGVFTFIVVAYRYRSRKIELQEPFAEFLLTRSEEEPLSLYHRGEKISISDPHMRRLWELIYDLKKESQSEVYLSDLDQRVFRHSTNAALNSRTRGKLFNVIEEMAGSSLIEFEKSMTDKRYKIVRFNLSKIRIQEA